MKRGIFRRQSIEICIEHQVLATPITPAALVFTPGEEMVVATTRAEAALGEYQFVFTIGEHLGEDPVRAGALFGRPSWKHLYALDSVTAIRPFSLADVVAAAGTRGPDVEYRYKGQTQHHRIIRTIEAEDEGLWRALLVPGSEPATSAAAVVEANAVAGATRAANTLTDEEIVRRLRRLSSQNGKLGKGRAYRVGKSQRRNREFAALIRALYGSRCQVCGTQIADSAGTRTAAHVHHFTPWDGDRSDRLDNVICVCPNDHARFELGVYLWDSGTLSAWDGAGWTSLALTLDRHLTVTLGAVPP